MRRRLIPRLAIAATATVATLGLGAGTAVAATTSPSGSSGSSAHHQAKKSSFAPDVKLPGNPTLQQIQAAAKTDIANRVSTLNSTIAKVDADKYLGGDKPTVEASLRGDIPGLQQLGQKIAADTDLATAKIDYGNIFSTYRVYYLEVPRTRLIESDDRILNGTGPRLTKEAAAIKAKETPANQGQVDPLLGDLATQVNNATSAVKGEVPKLEGYTAAAFNANHDLLKGDKSATKGAAGDIKKASNDAKQAASIVGLKHGKGDKSGKGDKKGKGTTPSTSATPAPAPAA